MKRKRNIAKLRHTQGCLTDCIAYYLNLHPEHVPFFVYPRKGWMDRVRAFFKKHGLFVYWDKLETSVPKRGVHIVCGDSLKWKTACHAVVYKNGKLIYDPQYPSLWKDNRITHILKVIKLKKK